MISKSTPRIFDLNNNGYVSKREFKWMTTNSKIDNEKVDLLFEVLCKYSINKRGRLYFYNSENRFEWRRKT